MNRHSMNLNTRCWVYVLVISFFLAAPAQAADGVIEINQTCAVQSGCLSGDAAGFPVSITQPGSYILTSNLEVSSVNSAITMDLPPDTGIRLDLNGFEIIGPVTCTGEGSDIECTGDDGVFISAVLNMSRDVGTSVRNGTVRGFRVGLALREQAYVTEITAIGNSFYGISVTEAGTISKCRTVRNASAGIGAGFGSIIEKNTATKNGAQGMFSSGGAIFRANIARLNGLSGINSGPGSTVIGNTSYDNEGFGLVLGAGAGYTENVLYSNNGTINDPQVSGPGIQMGINSCGAGVCP